MTWPEVYCSGQPLFEGFGPDCRTVTLVNTSTVTIILCYRVSLQQVMSPGEPVYSSVSRWPTGVGRNSLCTRAGQDNWCPAGRSRNRRSRWQDRSGTACKIHKTVATLYRFSVKKHTGCCCDSSRQTVCRKTLHTSKPQSNRFTGP
jgi:hypothetical protein